MQWEVAVFVYWRMNMSKVLFILNLTGRRIFKSQRRVETTEHTTYFKYFEINALENVKFDGFVSGKTTI